MKIQVVEQPDQKLMDYFEHQIEQFNLARWEVKKKIPLAIKIEAEDGSIVAGASAKTFGSWLLIDNIWVSESLRGQDVGTKILEHLHEAARKRGCLYALLDTLNFQARGFYEKFGYTVQWTQNEYPKTGSKHFMTKVL